jgi:hypothetical protein
MWIFCCGMYRSASTLQFQLTSRLVKEAGIGQQIGWIDAERFNEVRLSHIDYEKLKVVKVHLCTDAIASEFHQANAKGTYIFRDIRDAYISSMRQRMKTFDQVWNEGFIETCLDNYKAWTTLPGILVSQYEEVIENLTQEVKRIAQHLELDLEPTRYQEIASDYTVSHQKQRVEKFRGELLKVPPQDSDRSIRDYHDEESLLHVNHIDTGKVGRWQDELPRAEVSQIEAKVCAWCKTHQYSPSTFLRI